MNQTETASHRRLLNSPECEEMMFRLHRSGVKMKDIAVAFQCTVSQVRYHRDRHMKVWMESEKFGAVGTLKWLNHEESKAVEYLQSVRTVKEYIRMDVERTGIKWDKIKED